MESVQLRRLKVPFALLSALFAAVQVVALGELGVLGGVLLAGIVYCSFRMLRLVSQAEEAVDKHRELLNSLIDHSPSVVYSKSPDGRYLLVNAQFERLHGLKRGEVLGRSDQELFPAEMAERLRKRDLEVVSHGDVRYAEEPVALRNGEEREHFSVRFPLKDGKGGLSAVCGILTDVTEQRRMERTLAQRMFALDQSAIVAVTDRAGRITFANDNFCRTSGYSRGELVGETRRIVDSGHHDRKFFAEMRKTIISGNVWRGEVKNRNKDGSFCWVDSTITPLKDLSGKPAQFVVIGYDITARKAAEAALEGAKEEALSAARIKAEFLANMSHEIRTPMNGVIGICNLLLSDETDPVKKDKLKIIQSCGNTLLDLISDILDFSKLEVDKVELEILPFNLGRNVNDVIELLKTRASERGLLLEYKQGEGVPAWISGDVTRIKQVLSNLVSNAIKFTAQGSVEVTSSLRSRSGRRCVIQFSVRDTGVGISEETKNRLFRPFSQVDASTVRKYGGSGLGLAISKGLCERMGGTIWVDSAPGAGSTFHFTVSADEAEPREEDDLDPFARIDSELARRLPLRILVAEDNRVNQMVALGMLEKLGYRADVAANGLEAARMFDELSHDLILMDCHMPELDGYEATRRIRSRVKDGAKQPRIFAVTASSMKGDIDRCFEAGMDDFIGKPIQAKDLVRAIGQHFGVAPRAQAAAQSAKPAAIAPKPAPKPEIIDLQALNENFEGIEEGLQHVIQGFFGLCPKLLGDVKAAIDQGDAAALLTAAHAVKGVVSNFFAYPARMAAWELERIGSEKKLEQAPAAYATLVKEIDELLKVLEGLAKRKNAA